jgi:hypothetical protein
MLEGGAMSKRVEYKIAMHDGLKPVSGWSTCVPYFAVRKTGNNSWDTWVIDHIATGRSVKGNYNTRRDAKLIAGALSGLPIPWETITDDDQINARQARELLGTQLYNWMIT